MIHVAGADGISTFDDDLNAVGESVPVAELLYLDTDPTGRFLYGVSGVSNGLAHAWRISGTSLRPLGPPVPTGGSEPCHLALDPSGRHLLVANYGSATGGSVAVLPLDAQGSIGTATVLARETSPGPDAERQGESHIHQIVLGAGSAAGREVLVVDLGADQVVSYLLVAGTLTEPVVSNAPSGTGPRHLVLLPGSVAISGELGSVLLRADHRDRSLVDWASTPSTAGDIRSGDRNYPSDLRLGSDGRLLYLANRGVDSVTVLAAETGAIEAEIPCGAWPRHLATDVDRLFISSTHADEVGILDLRERRITRVLDVAAPMCVVVT